MGSLVSVSIWDTESVICRLQVCSFFPRMDKSSTVELIKLISAGNYTALRVRLKTDDVEETDAIGRTSDRCPRYQ